MIETRRWDPLTASASAALGTGTDMLHATTGIVTKPYEEYMKAKASRMDSQGPSIGSSTSRVSTNTEPELSSDTPDQKSLNQSVDKIPRTSGIQLAGSMAAASVKSLGNVIGHQSKGIFVDVPLAITDGLYAVPKLYGSEVREREKITNWKTGTAVAGKFFVFGLAEGMADIFVEPYRGGKKEGALGVVKGIGKGSLGFIAKSGAGKFCD